MNSADRILRVLLTLLTVGIMGFLLRFVFQSASAQAKPQSPQYKVLAWGANQMDTDTMAKDLNRLGSQGYHLKGFSCVLNGQGGAGYAVMER